MKQTFLLLTILALLLAGCAVEKTDIKTTGLEDPLPKPADYSNGSIWQSSSVNLTDDLKARQRGDIITIIISETASASKEAKTGTSRDSSVGAGIPNLMGLEKSILKSNFNDLANIIKANANSSFKGSGSTTRQENLKATITARVVDVMPNGNLNIEGRRNIKVNEEDQIIILEGTVRSRDISPDNTVNSIYVADARISYSGRGIISDNQSPGWLMNIFNRIWPF
ncbi:MAG: flagellar basal body L-ring protein FlgH [Geobacteraceae bacterium]|nr:flagellar basal body L-ring protein FlgH [Geobacteraceae bacterium]NTW80923.1 flagellar basal body L-ring protein FlgH [Geobacteraceae bacterium]